MPALRLNADLAKPATPMSDDMLSRYARNTTKRPLICFAVMVAAPFATELLCRIAESML